MTDLVPQSSTNLFNRRELGRLTPEHLPPLLPITATARPATARAGRRLAVPAPGSEAGSGLIELDHLHPPPRRRIPTPPPRAQRPARLAVFAPASWGSGVVDVHECCNALAPARRDDDPNDGFAYLATRDLDPLDELDAEPIQWPPPRTPHFALVVMASAALTTALAAVALVW